MKTTSACLFIVCFGTVVLRAAEQNERKWTNKEGKVFTGEYTRSDGIDVWIKKKGQAEPVKIAVASLSPADIVAVQELRSDFSWKLRSVRWPGSVSAPATRPAFAVTKKPDEKLHTFRTRGFEFKADEPLPPREVGEFGRTFEASIELFKAFPWDVRPSAPDGGFFQSRLFSNRVDFLKATGAKDQGSAKIAGLYKPDDRVICVPLESLRDGKSTSNGTLRHELAHQMMHDMLPVMPWWVAEGTAEYIRSIPWDGRGAYACDQVNTSAVLKKLAAEGKMNKFAFEELFTAVIPPMREYQVATKCAAARSHVLDYLLKIRQQRADLLAGRKPAEEGPGAKVIEGFGVMTAAIGDEGRATVLKYHASKMLVFYLQHLEGDGRGSRMLQLMWHLRQWADEYAPQHAKFEAEFKIFEPKFKEVEAKLADLEKLERAYQEARMEWARSWTKETDALKPVAPEEKFIKLLPAAPDSAPFEPRARAARLSEILKKTIGENPGHYFEDIIAAFKKRGVALDVLDGDPRGVIPRSVRIKTGS